jgi:hypothetical protein
MPVIKLPSLQEAEDSLWIDPGESERLLRSIAAVWALSRRLAPRRLPPGVYRHRSIEDANHLAEAWEAEAASGGGEVREGGPGSGSSPAT